MLGLVTKRSLDEAEAEIAELKAARDSLQRDIEKVVARLDSVNADLGRFQGLATQRGEALATVTRERDAQAQLVARLTAQAEEGRREAARWKDMHDAHVLAQDAALSSLDARRAALQSSLDAEAAQHAKARAEAHDARLAHADATQRHAALTEAHARLKTSHAEIEAAQVAGNRGAEDSIAKLCAERDAWKREAERAAR